MVASTCADVTARAAVISCLGIFTLNVANKVAVVVVLVYLVDSSIMVGLACYSRCLLPVENSIGSG
jgi:hypothetical protein